jgi:membrane-bound metal-dependent hydrolase YbcI (DUF457 family)
MGSRPLTVIRRIAWLLGALFWTAFTIVEAVNHGWLAGLLAVVFFIAPDLTFAVGAAEAGRTGLEKGQLQPKAVPFYNLAHRALVPLALAVVCTVLPGDWTPAFAGMCGWLAHISYDRALGFGLRTKEGFQRGFQRG